MNDVPKNTRVAVFHQLSLSRFILEICVRGFVCQSRVSFSEKHTHN